MEIISAKLMANLPNLGESAVILQRPDHTLYDVGGLVGGLFEFWNKALFPLRPPLGIAAGMTDLIRLQRQYLQIAPVSLPLSAIMLFGLFLGLPTPEGADTRCISGLNESASWGRAQLCTAANRVPLELPRSRFWNQDRSVSGPMHGRRVYRWLFCWTPAADRFVLSVVESTYHLS